MRKQVWKRVLSIMLVAVMVFSTIPVEAFHVHAHELEDTTANEQLATDDVTGDVVADETAEDEATEEPVVDEPAQEDSVTDELVTEDSTASDAVVDDSVVENSDKDSVNDDEIPQQPEDQQPADDEATQQPEDQQSAGNVGAPVDDDATDDVLGDTGAIGGAVTAPGAVKAGTLTVSDANIGLSWTDASNSKGTASWSASGTTITGTAKGYRGGFLNLSTYTVTTTLTITNNNPDGSTKTRLTFEYTLTNGGSVSADKGTKTGNETNGVFEVDLNPNGDKVVITLTSPKGTSTNTLTITNISVFDPNAGVATTFKAPVNGSYTVDGVSITTNKTMTKKTTESYAVVATPAENYKFFGWYNETSGAYLSYDASTSFAISEASTVSPVFIDENAALFGVGAVKFYDLTEAGAYAASGSTKTIVLLNNGTVSGSHTIPAGTTLLVPFNDGNTLYTTAPKHTNENFLNTATWVQPTAYRTLTLAANANIAVNGAISVSGKIFAGGGDPKGGGCGVPTDKVGFIKMLSGSKITLNSGANLYAWGYVTGAGEITAKSGAKVYESFQIRDFRGGGATTTIANDGIVFPLSQYYVQNVEVATKYEYGSEEHVYTALYISGGSYTASVKFIGDGAMFRPESGCVLTKDYVENKDRLQLTVNGNITLANMSMSLAGTEIDSANYILPINNNISIDIQSGTTTLRQDIAMLPGSELTIAQGATLNIAEGTGSGTIDSGTGYNLFVYDLGEWTSGYNVETSFDPDNIAGSEKTTGLHFVHQTYDFIALNYAPGRTYNRQASDLKDAVIDVNGTIITNGFMYTTESGASIVSSGGTGTVEMVRGAGAEGWTYQAAQADTTPVYYAILTDSAKLKNADGTYFETSEVEGAKAYTYSEGKWICLDDAEYDHNYTAVVTAPTCTAKGYTTYTCSICGHQYVGNETAAKGHDMQQTAAEIAATCTTAGKTAVKTCANGCGKTEGGTVIDATGHAYTGEIKSDGDGKDATHSFLCVNGCGGYGGAVTHTWNEGSVTTAPGCESEGVMTYTCTADGCGATYTEPVKANGHNFGTVTAKQDATCLATGNEAYKQCTVCKLYFAADAATNAVDGKADTASFVIAQKDHSYTGAIKNDGNGKDATHSFKCVNGCGGYGGAVTHTWNEGSVTTVPGCESEGVMTYTCTADDCGATYTEPVKANGHSFGTVTAKQDATCLATGNEAYKQCTVCKLYFAADAASDATDGVDSASAFATEKNYTNHVTPTEFTYVNNGDGTHKECYACCERGTGKNSAAAHEFDLTTKLCVCGAECHVITLVSVNGGENEVTPIEIHGDWTHAPMSMKNYEFRGFASQDWKKPEANEKNGYTFTPEGDMELRPVFVAKTDWHRDAASEEGANNVEQAYGWPLILPTLTWEGYTLVGWTVGVGGEELNENSVFDGASDYYAKWIANKYKVTFTINNEVYGEPIEFAYGAPVIAPTDYDVPEGYTFSDWNVPEKMPAEDITLNATLEINQYVVHYCVDGVEYAADSYDYGASITLRDPLTKDGYTFSGWKDAEGNAATLPATMPARDITVYGTWTANEYMITFVSVSEDRTTVLQSGKVAYGEIPDYSKDSPTKAYDDTYHYDFAGWATAKDGEKLNELPAVTGETTYYAVFTKAEHSYGGGEVTAPTCNEKGTETYTCDCGYTYTEEKAALGHDEIAHEAKAPTCNDIGWDAYVTCSRCDYTTYEEKAALGHDEIAHDAKAPTCNDIGWDAYVTCSRCDYSTYAEKAALGHAYTYTANGNVITEICDLGCNHSATATLVLDENMDLLYTGKAIKPYNVEYSDGWVGDELIVGYSNNVDAGEATASISVGAAIAVANFTIDKAYAALISSETTTYYRTLAEAVEAAKSDDTVKLLDNEIGAGVVINKNITIDFGGHTYTLNSGVGSAGTETNGFQILADNNVTMKNGNIAANNAIVKKLIQNYANLTLEGVELIANDNLNYTLSINSGKVDIKNCTIGAAPGMYAFDACKYSSYEAPVVTATNCTVKGIVEVTGGNLTVEGGTYTSNDTDVFVVSSGLLTIDGNPTVTGGSKNGSTAVWAKDTGEVVVNGGTYTVGADETAAQGYNDVIYARDNAVITITGGTFDGPARDSDGQKFLLNLKDGSNAKIVVSGGTFVGFDPQDSGTEPAGQKDDFTADGFIAVKDGENYVVKAHTHAYTYEAADGVMTQNCTTECRHSATATLVLDPNADLTYTGNAIEPYSVAYSDSWAGEKLTVSYENNTHAGTATAKLVAGEVVASVDFTIGKATPTYTAPAGLTVQINQTLADVMLPEGWSWNAPETVISTYGEQSYEATYTPADSNNYVAVTNVQLTVNVWLRGDLDLDGDVDSHDLTLLARHVGGVGTLTNPTSLKNADVNLSGDIDAADMTLHARIVGGVIGDWDTPATEDEDASTTGGNEA